MAIKALLENITRESTNKIHCVIYVTNGGKNPKLYFLCIIKLTLRSTSLTAEQKINPYDKFT